MRSIDIKVGMKILIRKGPEMSVAAGPWSCGHDDEPQTRRDKKMEGVVFVVKGVSPPFIAIKPYAGPGFMDEDDMQTGHLDLRDYEIGIAQPSYVRALRENVRKPLPQPMLLEPVDTRPMRQRLVNGIWVWEACDE